jgi:hypothetical protein
MKREYLLSFIVFLVGVFIFLLNSCTFKINEQPPDVSLVIDNYTVEATQVKVTTTVTYTDNGKMDRIELYDTTNLIQTKSVTSKQGSERFVFPVPIEEGKIRQLRLKAKAYDKAGNVSESQEATLTLYFVAPEISIENEYVGSFVDVKIGKGAKLRKIEVYEGGRKIGEKETTKSEGTERVEVEISEDATEIKVKAVNEFGIVGETRKQIVVDKTNPEVSIKSAVEGSYVSGEVEIEVEATDVNLSKVELYVNDEKIVEKEEGVFKQVIDTTKYTDGEYTIKVVAYDKAWNRKEKYLKVKFDNAFPAVVITSPESNSYVCGEITIQATASDGNGIKKVELYIDDEKIDELQRAPYVFKLDTTQFVDKTYTIKVVAEDNSGKRKDANVTIKIDNTAPYCINNLTVERRICIRNDKCGSFRN